METQIQFDHLLKMIESLVAKGVTYRYELDELLQAAFNKPVEEALMENALESLQEKYSAEYSGIAFGFDQEQVAFHSRSASEIISNNYHHLAVPIEF